MVFFQRILTALFIGLLPVPTPQAVIVKPLSIDELSRRAHLVIRATVLSKTCARDEARRIYTRIELNVTEVWKGNLKPGKFEIVHGGGVLGEERVVVTGQAEYSLDEDVVLFLIQNHRGEGVTVGLAQGKFQVRKDLQDGTLCVQNAFHGQDRTGTHRLTLSELKSRVQGVHP